MSTIRKLPEDSSAARYLKEWKTNYIGYGVGHYLLVILGIIAGGLVAASAASATASEPFIDPAIATILGIIAAAAVAITNALDTGGKYKRFNKAWVLLNSAAMKYETDPAFTLKEVTNAYETGENAIMEKTEVVTT
jgi:hypothetical protein